MISQRNHTFLLFTKNTQASHVLPPPLLPTHCADFYSILGRYSTVASKCVIVAVVVFSGVEGF